MSEFTELLRFLHGAGTSIIPWICVAVIVWLVINLRPHIVEYIKSQNDAKIAYIKKEGERNEIIRNCSATIEACTTALEMVSNDRKSIIERIDDHEKTSKERFDNMEKTFMDHFESYESISKERLEHIQTVVNQCRDEILKSSRK